MSQDLISFQSDATNLTIIDDAFKTLEGKPVGLIGLSVEQRSTLMKVGDKSKTFCRQAVELLNSSPGVFPANFNLQGIRCDLVGFDTSRPHPVHVEKLLERMQDSQLTMGSGLITAALEDYTYLRVAGKGEGLDSAWWTLSAWFSRGPRKTVEEVAEE